jgi:hypothetical protein
MPAGQGVAGVERVAARDHHDRNPVRLLGCCRHLAIEDVITIGEGQAEIAVGAPDMDGHLGASRNSEEAREAVDHRRRGQDLGSKVGELLDEAGRGQQIAVLFRLVPEEDGLSAGLQSLCEPAHFIRRQLRRRTGTGRLTFSH